MATKAEALDRQLTKQEALDELTRGEPPCFVAGTLVRTKDGLKAIEDICVGDWVLSYPDDRTPPKRMRKEDEYDYRQVTQTYVHEDKPVCDVTVLNFASNIKETFKVTVDHPFFVEGRGWLPAGDLNYRCPLLAANFGNLAVAKVARNDERTRVYNFEVDEYHTYYVGRVGVWVHNTCGGELAQLPPLREIRTEDPISLYKNENWLNLATEDTAVSTGKLGEYYAQNVIEAETGLKFLSDEIRNGGRNNGPDLWNLNETPLETGQKAQLTVLDAKGATVSNFPTPMAEQLYVRTVDWIEQVHQTGMINGNN